MPKQTGSQRNNHINTFGAVQQPNGNYIDKHGDFTVFNEEGQLHNEEGPARIGTNGDLRWYLNDEHYSFEEWCKELQYIKLSH
jgi:flagellar basal body rod protein FlgG